MGSGYFGELNLNSRGNNNNDHHQRSGSSSASSSRKGKKGSSSDQKPKQPQRGLGVAQLEKIRLHSQMGSSSNNYLPTPSAATSNIYPPPPNLMINQQQDDMIRIQTAYSSSTSSFSYSNSQSMTSYSMPAHQNSMMNLGEFDRSNIRYGDSPANASWNAGNMFIEAQHFAQPGITRRLLNLEVEDSLRRKKKDRSDSMGSSSQNSDSNGSQEVDLELRLSL